MTDGKPELPGWMLAYIKTVDDAKAFQDRLHAEGMMFHFEDSPETIGNGLGDQWTLSFTANQAAILRVRVAEMYELDWGELECPIGYALTLVDPDWKSK